MYDKLIEPRAAANLREDYMNNNSDVLLASIAISLRRIADGMHRVPETDEVYRARIAGKRASLGYSGIDATIAMASGAKLDGLGEYYDCQRRYV